MRKLLFGSSPFPVGQQAFRFSRHSRESGNLVQARSPYMSNQFGRLSWIPAYAGMTLYPRKRAKSLLFYACMIFLPVLFQGRLSYLSRGEEQHLTESLGPISGIEKSAKEARFRLSDIRTHLGKVASFLVQRDELPEQTDLIMALGSDDMKVPMKAAQLYLQGKAAKILVSGGVGRLTYGLLEKFKQFLKIRGLKAGDWIREEDYARDEQGNYILDPQGNKLIPEAKIYEKMLRAYGVSHDAILVEWKSQNTGENIQFSKNLLIEKGLVPGREIQKVILVQSPLLQKRAALTFKKEIPNVELINVPPELPAIGAMSDVELQRNMKEASSEIQKIQKYSKLPSEGGPEDGPYIVATEIPSDVLESSYRLATSLAIPFNDRAVYQIGMPQQRELEPIQMAL